MTCDMFKQHALWPYPLLWLAFSLALELLRVVSFPVLVQPTTSPWLCLYSKNAPLIVRPLTHVNDLKTWQWHLWLNQLATLINCSFVHQVSRYTRHVKLLETLTMNRSPIMLNFAVLRMSYFSHPFLSISSWAMTSPMPQITPVLMAWVTSGLVSSIPSYQTHRRRRGTRIRFAAMEERGVSDGSIYVPPNCPSARLRNVWHAHPNGPTLYNSATIVRHKGFPLWLISWLNP